MTGLSIQKHTTTTTCHELRLAGRDIIKLLGLSYDKVPDDAAVTVYVPGGGDWSNTTLDLSGKDPDTCVRVQWTTTKEE